MRHLWLVLLTLACGGRSENLPPPPDTVSNLEYCQALQEQAILTPPQAVKWQQLDCASLVVEESPVIQHSGSMTCYIYSHEVTCVKEPLDTEYHLE